MRQGGARRVGGSDIDKLTSFKDHARVPSPPMTTTRFPNTVALHVQAHMVTRP